MEWGRLSCLHPPGTGPTLILIPGSFDDSSGYRDVIHRLDCRMCGFRLLGVRLEKGS